MTASIVEPPQTPVSPRGRPPYDRHGTNVDAPPRAPAQVLLFWDYDTQWGADRSRLPGGPKRWGWLEGPYTDRLLEIHAEYDIPACFAVVGAAARPGPRPYHDPEQIRRMHQLGHEVASHSHRHEWLPGLGSRELRDTLRASREALEDCIAVPVRSFVPPFNQPFDYPAGWSVSLGERREAGRTRTDLARLCEALEETGYRFCRVAYRPLAQRVAEWCLGRRLDRPSRIEHIGAIACVRLNTAGGFGPPALAMLDRCVRSGGLTVVYGHPHSLAAGDSQDERVLVPFLRRVRELQRERLAEVILPRQLWG
ncbi:MAG TPA: polysaccharide deacetylase family protein [Vicinamibacterales bacterium]|nr:polysaccharide deacetylase family protein [Vicinamibacterales bacterium]